MQLTDIVLMTGLAATLRAGSLWGKPSLRAWLIFTSSVLALFWLQPAMPVRNLDFWLPVVTLALAVLGWLLTAPPGARFAQGNVLAGGLITALVLLVALTRYTGAGDWLVATRPPPLETVLVGVGALAVLLMLAAFAARGGKAIALVYGVVIWLLLATLIVLKTPALAAEMGRGLRLLVGQNPDLATAADIRWLGFSYICFRLVHTLRDRQSGRLPAVDLADYVSYVVFFPALVAGPIDRLDRFARDLAAAAVRPAVGTPPGDGAVVLPVEPAETARRAPGALGIVSRPATLPVSALDPALADDLTQAARRIAVGLFKKFALADSLALIALSPGNALQVREPGWLWLLVYLYAFQIYLDFSGYTDIAIGLGRIFGIRLPENFNRPYFKPNLTQFWNAWHMTLTQWFRAYFFNPLVRWLRVPQRRVHPVMVLLLSQALTMLLIGLWHGVTVNFVLWGLWHGLGLFAQNRWSELSRSWFAGREFRPGVQRALGAVSVLFTFHYVALGWVWFVLPEPRQAVMVFLRLFGGGG